MKLANFVATEIASLTLDAINPEFYFDPKTSRYRYRDTKQFAPKQAVISLTQKYIIQQQRELEDLAYRFEAAEIDLKQLQTLAADKLKKIHVAYGFLGKNGVENMQSEDFLVIARELKRQYGKTQEPGSDRSFGLRALAEDIVAGRVPTASRLAARLRLFGQSGKLSYWAMQRRAAQQAAVRQGVLPLERRRLHSRQECADCARYARMGWVTLGTLPLPTQQCRCINNCKCTIEYSPGGLMQVQDLTRFVTEGVRV